MGPWPGRVVCSLVVLSVAGGLGAEPPRVPIAVSPGGPERFLAAGSTCPTFSWTLAGAVETYELAVHEVLDTEAVEMAERPSLRAALPAGATSWTPPLERCLAPDRAWAWVVRSAPPGAGSEWSEPRLFRTPAAPTAAELEEILRRLAAATPERVSEPAVAPQVTWGPGAVPGSLPTTARSAEAPAAVEAGAADIVIDGDYRYAAGRTRHVFVPGSNFLTTFDDAVDVYRRINRGYGYVFSGTPPLSVNLQTTIQVPAGARITDYAYFAADLSETASARIETELYRVDSFANSEQQMLISLVSATGVGAAGTCNWCEYSHSFSPLPPAIQPGESLFVVVTWQPTVTGNYLRFQGVRISYTVDRAE